LRLHAPRAEPGAPLAAALTFALALLLLPPWIAGMPSAGIDSSWALALSYAFDHGWQFGRDIVFTLGPYSFLYSKLFDPGNFRLALGLWLAFALAFALGANALFEGMRLPARLLATAALFAALGAGAWGPWFFADPFFLLVPLLFALLASDSGPSANPSSRGWLRAALLALSALGGLVKFTFLLFGLACVAVADLQRVRQRRLPWYTAAFAALTLAFFALAGQSPANFAAWIGGSLAITRGYGEAMQQSGSTAEVAGFIAVCSCFLLLALASERGRHGRARRPTGGIVPWLAWPAFVFLVFKAAFVRHDAHVLIGWSSMAAATVLCLARMVRLGAPRAARAAMAALCITTLGIAIARHCRHDHESFGRFANRNFGSGLLERADAARRFALGRLGAGLTPRYEASLAAIRAGHPLPAAAGTVDAMPWETATVIASGLPYHPRPVFQSFAAYDAALIELNRAFVRGPGAASAIVFEVDPIDQRLAAEDDGALWPDLVARYDATRLESGGVLLTLRPQPRPVRLAPIGAEVAAPWGTPVPVPAGAPMVWVSIDARKSVLGRLADLAFKLPVIDLVLTFEDGTRARRRLVPGIARSGFLLSPAIESANAFARLLQGDARLASAHRRVSRIQIDGPRGISWFYGDSVRVAFEQLSVDGAP
jgi:hypothetical protein